MSDTEKMVKRMRVFAGPNGSGKSTIIKEIQKVVRTGVYINADDIEKAGRERKFINLGDYSLESDPDTFDAYLKSSSLVVKAHEEGLKVDLSLSNNVIRIRQKTNSYEAALVSDYIRRLLIASIIPYCHRCFIFDNSLNNYRLIIEVEQGENIIIHNDILPHWVDQYVLQKLGV